MYGRAGTLAETWRALLAVPEGAPNPFDANALERTLRLADQAVRRGRTGFATGIPESVLRTGSWPRATFMT
jgi:hypothetical protein